jgi:FkbM family methyltransferase
MKVDLRDEFVARELFANKVWEPEVQRIAECCELDGGIALDVGANIGAHTVYLSALTGNSGQVYAFEPEPYNFSLLKHNVRLNSLNNVVAQRTAIGNRAGVAGMRLAKSNWGDHRIAATGDIEVPMVTLDDALPPATAGKVRFIKIDVQGYEQRVLEGMKRTIEANPNAIIVTEIFPQSLKDAGSSASAFLALIRSLGLSGWEINDYRISPIAAGWVYDRFIGRREENLILSRNPRRLAEVLSRYLSAPIPLEAAPDDSAIPRANAS